MHLADTALSRLLVRGERARLTGSTRTIRESFTSERSPYWQQKLSERDAMHTRMKEAATAGAVKLEWARQGGDDRPLDAVVLTQLDLLAAYLERLTVEASVTLAGNVLARWRANPRVEELLDTWKNIKQVRSLGPESASDFADALRVLDAMAAVSDDQVVRQFSVQLFRNSKRIEMLYKHLDVLTSEAQHSTARHWSEVLGAIGLTKEPQPFLLSGTGFLWLADGVHCPIVRPFVGVANSAVQSYSGTPAWLLTIENLTTFHQAAKALANVQEGLVLYTAGMPSPSWGRAYISILSSIPASTRIFHWGDHDEGGFRIAARIAQFSIAAGRRLEPWSMEASRWGESGDDANKKQHRSMIRSATRAGWIELAAGLPPVLFEQEGQSVILPG